MSLDKGDRVCLIDGSAYIFRAYHALPPLSRSDGTPIGAVSGFCNMLFKLTEELKGDARPTHIAVIFDAGSKTFRNEIYSDYKAHRPPPPEDLIPQFALCRKATEAFGIKSIEMVNYEADDLIATYAKLATEKGIKVDIYSSDKDLMQLVNDDITLVDPMKNKRIGREQVFEKFGVYPDKVCDVQALAGDSSDNIPGVAGIGIKTAAELINSFGDLETLLKNAETIKQNKRRENLIAYSDMARISYKLVCLKGDVEVKTTLDECEINHPDIGVVGEFLRQMELNSLLKRITARMSPSDIVTPPPASVVPMGQGDLFGGILDTPKRECDKNYKAITEISELKTYIDKIYSVGHVAFDTETTSLQSMTAKLVGVSLSVEEDEGVYIPLGHKSDEKQIPLAEALSLLRPMLADDSILKIGHNIKYDMNVIAKYDCKINAYDDTMVISFCLYGGKHRHNMDELSQIYLEHIPISYDSVTGTGRDRKCFSEVAISDATLYAAEDSDITLRLWKLLKPRLIKEKKLWLYETIERKMPALVATMEQNGILVDKDKLKELSKRFAEEAEILAQKIYTLAGMQFNIASPKQMGEVLFNHMKIEQSGKKKKTATGQMSTGADILEELALEGHEIAELILAWRSVQKLKSTYSDAIPEHIVPETGRVHTAFHLTGAATGRFSSTDPNVQNIPIRTPEGRLIRQCFIAPEGKSIISADYSQIELRLLADIAGVKMLQQAFTEGQDIHTRTASEIFSVPIADVTSDIRRKAKAVNFGIIYGISAFGLARQLKTPQSEAKDYIDRYFAHFPEIKNYMEQTKILAKDKGYVETLFGRRIHIKEIDARNFALRANAERAAINAPIQGSAADIIKLAMIDSDKFIAHQFSDAKLLLQIHDELLFEVPTEKTEIFCQKIKKIMENAPLDYRNFTVKPVVETGFGKNWDEAH